MFTQKGIFTTTCLDLKQSLIKSIQKKEKIADLCYLIWDSDVLEDYGDIIAMVYREEYYEPETEDRGIVELILTTHRNGPVGTVKLLFEPQFGRYRNLAA